MKSPEKQTVPALLLPRPKGGAAVFGTAGEGSQEVSMKDPPRPHRLLWILGLLLLVGTAAGAGWVLNHHKPEETNATPKPNSMETPPSQAIVCFGFGDVEQRIANLHPVQAGRVVEVVAEGTAVKKGDVILRLDDRLAEIEKERAKADWDDAKDLLAQATKLPARQENLIEQQKQAIAVAQSKRAGAQQEFEVKEKLHKEGKMNVQVLRATEEELHARDAEVKAAQLKLQELELVNPDIQVKRAERAVLDKKLIYDKAKLALDECVLRAPEDGTVLRVLTQVGETLSTQPKLPAIEFCPKAPRVIRAEVMQEWAGRIKEGQAAIIEDDTRAGIHWHGKVKHISDWYTHRRSMLLEPFQYNDVRTLECIVSVDPGGSPLRIGQRVRVTIEQGGP
jgi:multidrug resistance efflux pump